MFCKGPRGERNGKALSKADLGLRSSQSVNSHKTRPLNRVVFSFVFVDEFVQSVAFRATCLRGLLFAVANLCLCLMLVFENKFSASISQTQQSSIATTALRSPLNCCDRSNLLREKGRLVNRGGVLEALKVCRKRKT